MKPKARFIKSVIAAAQDCDTTLPWARGKRNAIELQLLRRSAQRRKLA
ncbi:hypothetical protein ACFORG_09530 [Lutimaribacter marinistellae]|uniref:Transposase n=1 Tax=Lutimaribacter marinistellae TaxID=1820329 RepID=A0ABV7TGK4_9RHOB